jgi:hypothetical protein
MLSFLLVISMSVWVSFIGRRLSLLILFIILFSVCVVEFDSLIELCVFGYNGTLAHVWSYRAENYFSLDLFTCKL